MLYMIVETFKDSAAVYRRFRERGRLAPDGLTYVSSWITADVTKCYQWRFPPPIRAGRSPASRNSRSQRRVTSSWACGRLYGITRKHSPRGMTLLVSFDSATAPTGLPI